MKTLITACALALAIAAPAGAAQYKSEYKLSTVVGTQFTWGRAGERWAQLVREKTKGRINIKLYPGAALVGGDQTKEFSAVRQGVIDMAVGSSINWSSQVKQLNLFSLPFLVHDFKDLDAIRSGEAGKELFAAIEKAGVVPLAWGENGFRELSNSKHPVLTPADLKGMKIRVVGSPIFIDTFSALGANPTQMSWADAQSALATKAVDGQENPLSIFVGAKLHQLGQKYLTMWGYMNDPLIFVVNRKVWENWSPEDREAVRAAAVQAGAENVAAARKGISPGDDSLIKDIERSGVVIFRPSTEQKRPFKAATKPVYDKWSEVVGRDLVKKAEKSVR